MRYCYILILSCIFCISIPVVTAQEAGQNDLLVEFDFDRSLMSGGQLAIEADTHGKSFFTTGLAGESLDLSASLSNKRSLSLGTSDKLNFGSDRSFSVQVWVKSTTAGEYPIIASKSGLKDMDSGWLLGAAGNGSWRWNISDGNHQFGYRPTVARQPVNDGQWHQLVFSFNRPAEEVWIYYDGLNVAIYNVEGLGNVTSGSPVCIGGIEDKTATYKGLVDNVRIWDRAVTSDEVAAIWASHRKPKLEPTAKKVSDIKVLTWNIWHGGRENGAIEGVNQVIDVIRESGADIISMQETYGSGEKIADALGYYFYLRSANLSIMSRYPIGKTIDIYILSHCGGARINLSKTQQIDFYTIWLHYLPSLTKEVNQKGITPEVIIAGEGKYRLPEMKDILKEMQPSLKNADRVPVILSGDFNSPSHLDWIEATRDQHAGLVVEWPVTKAVCNAGMVDSYRYVHSVPDKRLDRTWTPRFPENYQDRIDFIFYKGQGVEAVAAEMIDQHPVRFPSDHAAVSATLLLTKESN